jgi:hypothetical protein
VAADIDTRHLVDLPANVEVRTMDARRDEIGSGFDLIHARCLLQHLPERDQVLQRLVAALRAGGCLVCEETTAGVTSGPVIDRLVSDPEAVGVFLDGAIIHTEMAGIDWIRHAYRLPIKFEEAGLERVGSQMSTPFGRGGEPPAMFLFVSRQNAAAVSRAQDGGQVALEARIDAWLTDPSEVVVAPPLVSSWGFKPMA